MRATGLLFAALCLFAAIVFLGAFAWRCRQIDPMQGDYRDKQGKSFGRFSREEWNRIRKTHGW